MVGHQVLVLSIVVRVHVPQQVKSNNFLRLGTAHELLHVRMDEKAAAVPEKKLTPQTSFQ